MSAMILGMKMKATDKASLIAIVSGLIIGLLVSPVLTPIGGLLIGLAVAGVVQQKIITQKAMENLANMKDR